MNKLDFWFDFSSPFAYLAATQVDALCARTQTELRCRPFLLGALFKAIGTNNVPLFAMPKAKQEYYLKDLYRWADYWHVPFLFPTRFPMNTVRPLRMVLAADPAHRGALIDAIFAAYWVHDRDIAEPKALIEIADEAGCDGAALIEAIESPAIKQALRDATDAAVAAGLCGAPTMAIGDELYWGQDRLVLVEARLAEM